MKKTDKNKLEWIDTVLVHLDSIPKSIEIGEDIVHKLDKNIKGRMVKIHVNDLNVKKFLKNTDYLKNKLRIHVSSEHWDGGVLNNDEAKIVTIIV